MGIKTKTIEVIEVPKEIQKQYQNVKLELFDAIQVVNLLAERCKLGTENVVVMPMEGVAIKTLLETCKKEVRL